MQQNMLRSCCGKAGPGSGLYPVDRRGRFKRRSDLCASPRTPAPPSPPITSSNGRSGWWRRGLLPYRPSQLGLFRTARNGRIRRGIFRSATDRQTTHPEQQRESWAEAGAFAPLDLQLGTLTTIVAFADTVGSTNRRADAESFEGLRRFTTSEVF
jgi:hypothetical protein